MPRSGPIPYDFEKTPNNTQIIKYYRELFPKIGISNNRFKNDSLYRLAEMSGIFRGIKKIKGFKELSYFEIGDINGIKNFITNEIKQKIYDGKIHILLDFREEVIGVYFLENNKNLKSEDIDTLIANLKEKTSDGLAKIFEKLNIL